jgi:hypothetical protein
MISPLCSNTIGKLLLRTQETFTSLALHIPMDVSSSLTLAPTSPPLLTIQCISHENQIASASQ